MSKIYLIKSINEGIYKIGVSKKPNVRLKELQTGNPSEITILHIFESDYAYKIENALHNRYAHYNTHGEWFELSLVEEMTFIETCQKIENSIKFLVESENPFI